MVRPSHNRILAEIIVSSKVGGVHLRRVGEVLVAREDMNARFMNTELRRFSEAEFDEIIEKSLVVEEEYIQAWSACEVGTRDWRHSEGLAALDHALMKAAIFYRNVASTA